MLVLSLLAWLPLPAVAWDHCANAISVGAGHEGHQHGGAGEDRLAPRRIPVGTVRPRNARVMPVAWDTFLPSVRRNRLR
jgi:hypothetical protein